MREHLQHELAQQPTLGPPTASPSGSDDEYTRAHPAGQNLETWIHDRIMDALNQSD
ncbi:MULTISPECIES: hypothetical protein [Rhodococcus]|jgi:hypothetical protein|uniref:hypothetical protein n=1 Tax=Rhodococcus TaxID=1827 RepID=UPI0002EB9E94|nr:MULTISPECIES: hypothetical protein [Rhodococcus]